MSIDSENPFYDVNATYEENYAYGPFGSFSSFGLRGNFETYDDLIRDVESSKDDSILQSRQKDLEQDSLQDRTKFYDFFGQPVRSLFGIPAGPLLNSRFTTAAFAAGFDINVYKTVRSRQWECNPFPNVLSVHPHSADGILMPDTLQARDGLLADRNYAEVGKISISNSFGVPSQDPDIWQPDMAQAVRNARRGQVLVGSFQGTRLPGMSVDDYIRDHVIAARLVAETGARVLEMNTSCPNEGKGKLLCDDPELIGGITEAVKNEIGDIPLIIKLAYMPTVSAVETMMHYTVLRGTVQGFATINTISARLVDKNGHQALPGAGRETSGVCGFAIKNAGVEMVARVRRVQEQLNVDDAKFSIIGVGGVSSPVDVSDYRDAGAHTVMSATGAMWNTRLGRDVARECFRTVDN